MTSFHFRDRHSILHQADPRIKLPLFFLIQTLAFDPPWLTLACCFGLLIGLMLASRSRVLEVAAPLPYLFWLFVLILALRLWPFDPAAPNWWPNLLDGARYCLQLIFLLGVAQIFLLTTRINDIRGALVWYLRVLPQAIRYQIGLALSLVFRFIPLLLDFAVERKQAAINRGYGRSRRNLTAHARHLRLQTLGLLNAGFAHAQELEVALRARRLDQVPGKNAHTLQGFTDPRLGWSGALGQGLAAGLTVAALAIVRWRLG